MRRSNSAGQTKEEKSSAIRWKRRPSEIHGYQRTIYVNTDDGDYIRVDYNLNEKRVRIYIEDYEEGGNPYYSVISNGKITVERNATTGRAYKLSHKFNKRAPVLSTITNKHVIKLINKNYGINESKDEEKRRKQEKKLKLEQTRKRYFSSDQQTEAERRRAAANVAGGIRLLDFVDLIIGCMICFGVFFLENNFVYLGIVAASFGVIIGMIDMFFRNREPVLLKVLLFIFSGLASYVYGYYFF